MYDILFVNVITTTGVDDISHEVAARLGKILYYKICFYSLTCQMLVWYIFLVLCFGGLFL